MCPHPGRIVKGGWTMKLRGSRRLRLLLLLFPGILVTGLAYSQQQESFASLVARMKAAKPDIMKRHMTLLDERYDLSNRPAPGVTMSRGKPVQAGVRAKLPGGMTWEKLAATAPEEIREKDFF